MTTNHLAELTSFSRKTRENKTKATHLVPRSRLHLLNDLRLLIRREQVRYIRRVQDHVDVLHERLVLNLRVTEQEHGRLALAARFHEHLLDVLAPLVLAVVLADLDLEQVEVGHERGQLRRALPTTAADADQERVAVVLFKDSGHATNVLDGELEHDKVHWHLADCVVLFQDAGEKRKS